VNDGAFRLPVTPQAERIAIGVNQVRQRLEFVPLILVVLIFELAWIGALSRRLDLDETDQSFFDYDREVRPRFQLGECRLAHELDAVSWHSVDCSQVPNESFQRTAKLILRCAGNRNIRELRFGTGAVCRNGIRKRFCCQGQFPGIFETRLALFAPIA
jgi:hypothetical protein